MFQLQTSEASMCHSSDRWSFWSRRQQKTEPVNRSTTPAPTEEDARKPTVEPREDERTRREKELERLP
ncbi:hypothetical protein GAY31_30135 [Azospirillum brasilense]|nr:hypothetical protein [Azospirillum brasilense]